MDELWCETAVDDALLALAHRDLTRVLVLQNARFAGAVDPVGRWRTAALEAGLRWSGLALSAFGFAVCALGVVLVGDPPPWVAGALALFAGLVALFAALPRLRRGLVGGLDRLMARRARRMLAPLRAEAPLALRYTRVDGELRCARRRGGGWELRFTRPLDRMGYALVGEAATVLLSGPRALTPRAVVLSCGSELLAERLGQAGIEVELLSRRLLPPSTVQRTW